MPNTEIHVLRTTALAALDADALYGALQCLASDAASQQVRDAAARILLSQLRVLSRRASFARFSSSAGFRYAGGLEESLEDAIQHVAIVASTGTSRFRGGHPNEAVAWCQRVFSNFLTSESRRRARNVSLAGDERGGAGARLEAHLEGIAWRHPGQDAALFLLRLESRVWSHLTQTRTREASESLYRAVRKYLAYLAGYPEQAAPARPSASEHSCSQAARRARDRQYQHHRRARQILAEVLAAEARQSGFVRQRPY